MEIQMGGGTFQLANPEWRGAQAVLQIQVDGGGGGSKNRAFCRGGVDFFWNNPIQDSPDFAPYLPVYRLESRVSTLKFPTIKFQIFCVV